MLRSESLYKVYRPMHNERMIRLPAIRICTADHEVWYVNADYTSKTIRLFRETQYHPFPVVADPLVFGKDDGEKIPAWYHEIRDPDGYLSWAEIDFFTAKQ